MLSTLRSLGDATRDLPTPPVAPTVHQRNYCRVQLGCKKRLEKDGHLKNVLAMLRIDNIWQYILKDNVGQYILKVIN